LAVVEKILTPNAAREKIEGEDGNYCPFCACPVGPDEVVCPDCLLDVALTAVLEE